MYPSIFARCSRLLLLAAFCVGGPIASHAQTNDGVPRLPGAPQPAPGATTPLFGAIATENFQVTSAANQHGTYLWIVAPAQHVVILCEKPDTAKDFTCTSKRLP